jgi:hypothetical protein
MDAAQNYLRGLLKVTSKGIITALQNANYLQTPGHNYSLDAAVCLC